MDYSTLLPDPWTTAETTAVASSHSPRTSSAFTVLPHSIPTAMFRHPTLTRPASDWDKARNIYGIAWDLHIYAIGSLFAVVSFYSLICTLKLCRLALPSAVRCYFMLLHFILMIFGVMRAVFLLLDPYNASNVLPPAVSAAFLHISFPCLTLAFLMVLAALIRAARTKLSRAGIVNGCLLLGIVVVNFTFAIGAEVCVEFLRWNTVAVASQTYFIAWSVGLGCGYLFMCNKLLSAADDVDSLATSSTQPSRRVATSVHITLIAALLLLIFASLHIFGMVMIYEYFRSESATEPVTYQPWIWYGFHTGTRITELLLSALLAFVASLTVWSDGPKESRKQATLPWSPVNPSEAMKQQHVLLSEPKLVAPSSPGFFGPKHRKDFPVTFNPERYTPDDQNFQPRYMISRHGNSTGRKPDSVLLETNPIHNDQERYN
ncbi:hypothetical protein RvY_15100 [Ramazzottius varieornatus]|uniref:Proline-rich transmembrane protein 3/4 domain-containing protein n=1 Tax=Ramazzottius varieornatus TaxID=947166 RepID=A0A1D1W0P1_RAMVA|nr:hypothetical protein RvY_15100 [Ramazzottius varieornatus]